jgi:hypothetical protein
MTLDSGSLIRGWADFSSKVALSIFDPGKFLPIPITE